VVVCFSSRSSSGMRRSSVCLVLSRFTKPILPFVLRIFGAKEKRFFVQFYLKKSLAHVQMVIDYSKWDTLKYSSSSEEEDDEGEKEALGSTRSALPLENLSLCSCSSSSSSPIWNGLVLHHKDVFVSHVLPKLNTTDRCFFSEVNRESRGVLEYAGVNVSGLGLIVYECSSISTLEWAWNHWAWGEKDKGGSVMDDGSSLVLRASCCNEQTRVSQVGERSETLRVG